MLRSRHSFLIMHAPRRTEIHVKNLKRTSINTAALRAAQAALAPGAAAAPAKESAEESPGGERLAGAMYVADIDGTQAKRAGNTASEENGELVLRNGRTGREIVRLPSNAPQRAADVDPESVTRLGITIGNCGDSWIWLIDTDPYRQLANETGFNIKSFGWAIDYQCRVALHAE
jgi:hypothetical protein